MKKLIIVFGLLFTTLISFGQNPIQFKFRTDRVTTDINGGVIDRGDEFEVIVDANGNGNTTARQLLFDFEYDKDNFELTNITHTGTGGNGGVLPQGATISLSYQNYPGYNWNSNANNGTTNGTTNYQYANYTYNTNNSKAIIRTTLTWSSNSGMPYTNYDRLLILRFKLKSTSTATTFDPIKFNFVAAWSDTGALEATFLTNPLSTLIFGNQNSDKYVFINVDMNSNLYNLTQPKLVLVDTVTKSGNLYDITSGGSVSIDQTTLQPNTVYQPMVMINMDDMYNIYNNAITISDFTTAQQEFTNTPLGGIGTGGGGVIQSGQSYYLADIDKNKQFDGGDLPRLLSQVTGLDTLVTLPQGYTQGSGGYMTVPTWTGAMAIMTPGTVEWGVLTSDGYSTGVSKLLIDMREFPQGTNPSDIKSIQLLDIYRGPIEFVSSDAAWAFYKVPGSFPSTSTSTYQSFIRELGNSEYAFKTEFDFATSPSQAWDALTSANWNTVQFPKYTFKTDTLGQTKSIYLKYALWGDINRSHSSEVLTMSNGGTSIQTNAVVSSSKNKSFMNSNPTLNRWINTAHNIKSIDVNFTNVTVTSNNIEIPISINTNGSEVAGLQFEFKYDPAKIKFDRIKSELPDGWYVFANSKSGRIKFGSLDNDMKTPIKGNNIIPFTLKFSTIGNGVDILTSVKVTPVMDASAIDGTQLGINLNTDKIKLTGYNNF